MNDIIYKSSAITLPVMPKEYRKYQTQNIDDAYDQGWYDLQKCIEQLPSAQPEIIKCEECMWWDRGNCYSEDVYVESLEYMDGDLRTEPDHFCGYAKRRTDDKRRGN